MGQIRRRGQDRGWGRCNDRVTSDKVEGRGWGGEGEGAFLLIIEGNGKDCGSFFVGLTWLLGYCPTTL